MPIDKPKFAVIIPTRERCDTLKWSLSTVTAQTYQNLEIIVSDNVSNDGTKTLVEGFNDPRIRYINTGERLSMAGNWEFALSHVSSDWVTLIGDDDGLLPGALEKVAKLIKETQCQAIQSKQCVYLWPSFTSQSKPSRKWHLAISTANRWEWRDSQLSIEKVISGRSTWELPYTYSGGFISYSVLQQIKEQTGKYYHSCSPEVYSALAVASLVKRHVYSFEPFAISGVSGYSNGAAWGKMVFDESEVNKFNQETQIAMHEAIPQNTDGTETKCWHAFKFDSYLKTLPLRHKPASKYADFQYQLMLFWIEELKEAKGLDQWCRLFADKHNLDFAKAKKQAKIYRYKLAYLSILDKLRPMLKLNLPLYVVFKNDRPVIQNVHEASLMIAAIRATKISMLGHIYSRWKNR